MGAMSSRRWFLEHAEPANTCERPSLDELTDASKPLPRRVGQLRLGLGTGIRGLRRRRRIDAFVTNEMSRNFSHSDHPMDTDQFIGQTEFDFYRHKDFKKGVNLAFANRGDLLFEAVSKEWGLDYEGMSCNRPR